MSGEIDRFGPYTVTKFARGLNKDYGYQIDRDGWALPIAETSGLKIAKLIMISLSLADTYDGRAMRPNSLSRETCEMMLKRLIETGM